MANFPPQSPALLSVLAKLSRGDVSVDEAASLIGEQDSTAGAPENNDSRATASIPNATVDLGRNLRCGFSEVIYGEGKSSELIIDIVQTQLDAKQTSLVTRIEPTTASQVRRVFKHTAYNPVARTLRIAGTSLSPPVTAMTAEEVKDRVHVAVVTAGSTDLPVAEESVETLHWMGIPVIRFDDIGVAGPQRLMHCADKLQDAAAVVVVAGMEGALPAAVGGHVPCPVIAVPTSVGYGTNLGGLTPLMGMLCSCTANVAVVNIDAGFKGGFMAGMIADRLHRAAESDPPTTRLATTVESLSAAVSQSQMSGKQ